MRRIPLGQLAAACCLSGAILTASPATPASAAGVTPGGMVATDYAIRGVPADGLFDLDFRLTVESEPTHATDAYFFADQFSFTGGEVAYMGLQPHGVDFDGSRRALAFFSAFGDGVSLPSDRCRAGPDAADGGPGASCRIPFALTVGRPYRLRVVRACCLPAGGRSERWQGTVRDQITGVEAQIGSWTVPGSWGSLSGTAGAFSEYFEPVAGCADTPFAQVRNGAPSADLGALRGVVTGSHTYGVCASDARTAWTPDHSTAVSGTARAPGLGALPFPPLRVVRWQPA